MDERSTFLLLISWFESYSTLLAPWALFSLTLCCLFFWYLLKRKDRWFSDIFNNSPSAIALIDARSYSVVYGNLVLQQWLDLKKTGTDYVHSGSLPLIEQLKLFESTGEISPVAIALDNAKEAVMVQLDARLLSIRGKKMWLCFLHDISVIDKMERSLKREKALFSNVMAAIPDPISCADREGKILGCNDSWANFYGMKAVDLTGKYEHNFILPSELKSRLSERQSVLSGESCSTKRWLQTPGGEQRLLLENQYPLCDDKGIYGVLSVAQDITDWQRLNKKLALENEQRKVTESQLASQNRLIRTVFKASPDPIAFINEQGVFIGSNSHFAQLYGLSSEKLTGMAIDEVLPADKRDWFVDQNQQVLSLNETLRYEEQLIDATGRTIWLEVLKAPYQDDSSGERGIFLITRDITERKMTEQKLAAAVKELEQLSFIDGLTRIANRRSFDERGMQLWKDLRREFHPLSLILADIDCFKAYNDNYGHVCGDAILVQVASLISAQIQRGADSVARYGGEEFAILLPNTDIDGACILAEQLVQRVFDANIPHAFSTVIPRLTMSFGVACIIPDDNSDLSDLIQLADDALYQAKAGGKNCFRRSFKS